MPFLIAAEIKAAAAERELLDAANAQQWQQEAGTPAAHDESGDATDAAAMQAALSRHSGDEEFGHGRIAGIMGLSEDLDAPALVRHHFRLPELMGWTVAMDMAREQKTTTEKGGKTVQIGNCQAHAAGAKSDDWCTERWNAGSGAV